MTEPVPELSRLGIGKVLDELHPEFPDLTITKIRYLEREGLIEPERTASGYRKFSYADVERLRFILRQQRDKFWPLHHIRQVLDDMDHGRVPDVQAPGIRVPVLALDDDGMPMASTFRSPRSQVRLTREQLLEAAGVDDDLLRGVEEHGLIVRRSPSAYYDGDDLHVVSLAAEFAALGLEPRHLRVLATAADRQVDLFEQVVTPRDRTLDHEDADQTTASLAALSVALQSVLLRRRLRG